MLSVPRIPKTPPEAQGKLPAKKTQPRLLLAPSPSARSYCKARFGLNSPLPALPLPCIYFWEEVSGNSDQPIATPVSSRACWIGRVRSVKRVLGLATEGLSAEGGIIKSKTGICRRRGAWNAREEEPLRQRRRRQLLFLLR